MKIAYIGKKFLPLKKAKVSILDRGLLYGDGAFETMRSYRGVIFKEKEHLDRLAETSRAIGFKLKISSVRKILKTLLKKSGIKNAYIKIIITRGVKKSLLAPVGKIKPTLIVYAAPFKKMPVKCYKKGINVGLSEGALGSKTKIAGKKSLNYLNNILCLMEAKNKGFRDVILFNERGELVEASSSNIFVVKGKTLFTPPLGSGCLPGITRGEVLQLAKKYLEINTREDKINKKALTGAREIFLTNSLSGIVPVVKAGKRKIGSGLPGPVTKDMALLLSESIKKYCGIKK